MTDENRQHKRIEKRLTIQFCLADAYPKKWEITLVQNISIGGVRFLASNDLELNDKTIQLQIKIPMLAPRLLELEAVVLNVKPRLHNKFLDVRVKFINLSEANKKDLAVIEKLIELQEIKESKKII